MYVIREDCSANQISLYLLVLSEIVHQTFSALRDD